jgi:hypothetical protein
MIIFRNVHVNSDVCIDVQRCLDAVCVVDTILVSSASVHLLLVYLLVYIYLVF